MLHDLADIQSSNIGENTNIWQFTVVLPNARIGNDCNICSHCFIENQVIIGDRVTLKSGVYLWDGTEIENDVFIGPNATFCNDRYPKSKNKNFKLEKIIVRQGASIGANATILKGVVVAEGCVIGAGTVLTKSTEPYGIYAGVPGRRIAERFTEQDLVKHKCILKNSENVKYI